jgi:SAM-dependent methyltransferase
LTPLCPQSRDRGRPDRARGFFIESGTRIYDERARESFCQYIVCAPVSVEKLYWDSETDTVLWRAPRKGPFKGEDRYFAGLDFIAQLTLHIPPKGNHLVRKGSASRPPFSDSSFDVIVSCLTFHEVGDVADKTESLIEALRVLKTGDSFHFFDLFGDPKHFGSLDHVRNVLGHHGAHISGLKHIGELLKLKFPLTNGKVLKFTYLITGVKE